MSVLIRVLGLEGDCAVDGGASSLVGNLWLKAFDVDAYDGRGRASFTDNQAKALRFADLGAAFNAWKTQSAVRPLRPDGKPNRPLTAFSVTFDVIAEPG